MPLYDRGNHASTDPDNNISLYERDLDYDGINFDVDTTGISPVFDASNLDGPFIRTLALRVTHTAGAVSAIDSSSISILNSAPTADAGGPYGVDEGSAVVFNASGTVDPSPLDTIVLYEWDLDHDGVAFDVDATGENPTFDASNLDGPSALTVAVRAQDDDGSVSAPATSAVNVANVSPLSGHSSFR